MHVAFSSLGWGPLGKVGGLWRSVLHGKHTLLHILRTKTNGPGPREHWSPTALSARLCTGLELTSVPLCWSASVLSSSESLAESGQLGRAGDTGSWDRKVCSTRRYTSRPSSERVPSGKSMTAVHYRRPEETGKPPSLPYTQTGVDCGVAEGEAVTPEHLMFGIHRETSSHMHLLSRAVLKSRTCVALGRVSTPGASAVPALSPGTPSRTAPRPRHPPRTHP